MPKVAQEISSRPEVAALLARGDERGCVNLSEFDELVQALELMDDDVDAPRRSSSARGIDISDDCGARRRRAHDASATASWPRPPPTPSSSS